MLSLFKGGQLGLMGFCLLTLTTQILTFKGLNNVNVDAVVFKIIVK